MLRYRGSILALLVVIFSLVGEHSVIAQCGPGKIEKTIRGFGAIVAESNVGSTSNTSLGMPDNLGALFDGSTDALVIDFIDTVRAGQQYQITWRQRPGQGGISTLNWSEALVMGSYTVHPNSGITTTDERFFNTTVVANANTRYIRIFSTNGNDFEIDAISFSTTKCLTKPCAGGYSPQLISGSANPLVPPDDYYSISYPEDIDGVPDGYYGYINNPADWMIINLPFTIPAGQNYYIVLRSYNADPNPTTRLTITESSDGVTWSSQKLTKEYPNSTYFQVETVTASVNTRYIKIVLASGNYDVAFIDGIIFNAISCEPAPPDLDATGTHDYCGNQFIIAPDLVISDPADQIISAAYVQFGTGFIPGQDRLGCTENFGITATYNSTYGIMILKGNATTSQYQSVLRSVYYNNISGTPTLGNREVTLSLERINHTTGHYYRYIQNPSVYWNTAWIESDRAGLFGMKGYLVTITSQNENDFLISQLTGSAWIGASDYTFPEGNWTWVTGPEAGTMFWQGGAAGSLITYANWNSGEPNNQGGEDYGHLLAAGNWNDLPVAGGLGIYAAQGYYIEFGGMPGDPVLDISGIVNVNVVTSTPNTPSITGSNSVCPNTTGVIYSTANVPGHIYTWSVTGGTIAGGQGSNSITVNWGSTNPGTVKVTESLGAGACSVTTADYTVFIEDNTAPSISGSLLPANVTGCGASAAPAAVTTVAALEGLGLTISDNCTVDASLVVTYSDGTPSGTCPITIIRTYTVTDAYSNLTTAQQTITIDDNTAPVITGTLAAMPVEGCTGADRPAATLTLAYLRGAGLTITDACGDAGLVVTYSDGTPSGTCPITIIRTYTVTDACGNLTTSQQTITIDDNTTPVITGTLAAIPVEGCTGADRPAATLTLAYLRGAGLTITDACGDA
ncbi:MAG TPA: lectin-like protein, partial [Bacteroidales bacterium]|nr:lectin-like protein [Bacteroidales bacterium]